jgi:hypothetical protein
MYTVLLVKHLLQSANSNNIPLLSNPFMDMFSSLVPDSKRYADLVGMTVFDRAGRFA